mmetsp:Transcript_25067/g.58087  ORF Transcript_25067/g.58087 Transcript_25067/m.58087 type:complete len:251 (+) Transcript_25067:126-878(+)
MSGGYNCLDASPVPGDPRYGYQNTWNTGMVNAPCADPCCCLASLLFPCCSAMYVRKEVLGGSLERYKCCQGYYDCMCFKAGSLGEESMPEVCLCLEALLCEACSISSSRFFIMDTRSIQPDPCDTRLIRLNNFLVLLSCVCHILAMIDDTFDSIADLVELISDIVYAIVSSCMLTQTHVEVKNAPRPIDWSKANLYPRSGSKQMREGGGGGGDQRDIPSQNMMGGGGGGGGGGRGAVGGSGCVRWCAAGV